MINCKILNKKELQKYLTQIILIDEKCCKDDSTFAVTPWNKTNYFMELRDKWGLSVIAIKDEQVSGCLIASGVNDEVCHLNRIFVSHEFRRHGIASLLLDSYEKRAKKLNYHKMMLFVHMKNTDARMVYEQNGWTLTTGLEFRGLCKLKDRIPISGNCFLDESGEENCIYTKYIGI